MTPSDSKVRLAAIAVHFLWNTVVAVVPLALWLGADYAYVKGGQRPDSFWSEDSWGVLVFLFVPLGFATVNWRIFNRRSPAVALALTTLTTLILTGVWLVVAVTLLINFHVAIGGSL